jgi:hypothetical protein
MISSLCRFCVVDCVGYEIMNYWKDTQKAAKCFIKSVTELYRLIQSDWGGFPGVKFRKLRSNSFVMMRGTLDEVE